MEHERHYTLDEANAAIPAVRAQLERLRAAREGLNDEEARAALDEAGPGNGGGPPGRVVSDAFMEMRSSLIELQAMEVVLRDLDRGLADFPSCATAGRSTSAGRRARTRSASGTSPTPASPAGSPLSRWLRGWRRLNFEQRVAAVGAVLLIVSTFGPFSFVEPR